MTVIRQNENILKRSEATQRFVRFAPSATSDGIDWKALQSVRYRNGPASGEFSLPHVSRHGLVLTIRPAERLEVRYEGVKLERPPVAGSINVIPAGSSVLWHRQGSIDAPFIHLEPSLVARVAEVAFRSGFANQSHFCLHFKRIVGVTPRQFQISARNGQNPQDH